MQHETMVLDRVHDRHGFTVRLDQSCDVRHCDDSAMRHEGVSERQGVHCQATGISSAWIWVLDDGNLERNEMSKEQIEEEFESFEEEMAYLVAEKSRLQVELSKYNKASLAREQMTIRKKYGNSQKSLEVWLLRSAELNDKRKEILEDLAAIEVDMREIKPMLQHEREQKRQKKPASDGNSVFRSDGSVDYGVVNLKMLEELKAIRTLLEQRFPLPLSKPEAELVVARFPRLD